MPPPSLIVVLLVVAAAMPSAQALTVKAAGDTVRIEAPPLGIVQGPVLERLREGRSVRLDVDLAVLEQPAGPIVTQLRQSFVLSFDLWEERFAVARVGTAARAISHLTAAGAEAWCLESLAIPLTALGRLGRDAPFWIRLAYRIPEPTSNEAGAETGLTLATLIERLSRRRPPAQIEKTMDAGPFRLSN